MKKELVTGIPRGSKPQMAKIDRIGENLQREVIQHNDMAENP